MDRSDLLILISEETSKDQLGVITSRETENQVFCNVSSVTSTEFHEGGLNGLRPAFRFTVFAYDYNGEKIVKYNGIRYSIYRTYLSKDNMIELYVQKDVGV